MYCCERYSTAVKDALVPSYSQKALHLQNGQACDAVYLPTASSSPGPVGGRWLTTAAFGKCGEGKLGYIGNVNNVDATEGVVFAICGLL